MVFLFSLFHESNFIFLTVDIYSLILSPRCLLFFSLVTEGIYEYIFATKKKSNNLEVFRVKGNHSTSPNPHFIFSSPEFVISWVCIIPKLFYAFTYKYIHTSVKNSEKKWRLTKGRFLAATWSTILVSLHHNLFILRFLLSWFKFLHCLLRTWLPSSRSILLVTLHPSKPLLLSTSLLCHISTFDGSSLFMLLPDSFLRKGSGVRRSSIRQ